MDFHGIRKIICGASVLVAFAEFGDPSSCGASPLLADRQALDAGPSHGGRQLAPAWRGTEIIETRNFRIHGVGSPSDGAYCRRQLESLRAKLIHQWLGGAVPTAWSPKCDVVVHATASSYLRAVGQAQGATAGASRIDILGKKVLLRRIDFRADHGGWFAEAAPHELTHVILADEFLGDNLPAWADEGMATLADTPLKRSLHLSDLQAGCEMASVCRLAELIRQTRYPSAAQIPVFYGQSLSLVTFLVDLRTPSDFVQLLHRAEQIGYDSALRETYRFSGIGDLERQWRRSLSRAASAKLAASHGP